MGLRYDFKTRWSDISYLINVEWNSIRLSGFLLRPQYLYTADEGGRLLKFGPFGNLGSSQRLSSSLFHHCVDFHLFQIRKDEAFLGRWTAFGTYRNDRKKIRSALPLVIFEGEKDEDKTFFLESSEEISIYLPICHDSCNQTKAFDAYSPLLSLSYLHKNIFHFFCCLMLYFFFFFPYVLSLNGSILLCGNRDRSWIPFCPPHSLPLA